MCQTDTNTQTTLRATSVAVGGTYKHCMHATQPTVVEEIRTDRQTDSYNTMNSSQTVQKNR